MEIYRLYESVKGCAGHDVPFRTMIGSGPLCPSFVRIIHSGICLNMCVCVGMYMQMMLFLFNDDHDSQTLGWPRGICRKWSESHRNEFGKSPSLTSQRQRQQIGCLLLLVRLPHGKPPKDTWPGWHPKLFSYLQLILDSVDKPYAILCGFVRMRFGDSFGIARRYWT